MVKKTVKKKVKKFASKVVRKVAKKLIKKTFAKQVKVKRPVRAPKKKVVKTKVAAKRRVLPRAIRVAVRTLPLPVISEEVSPALQVVGEVIHFYPHICVAVISLRQDLKQDDWVTFVGHEKNFDQQITSMQIEHKPVALAKKGQVIGLRVNSSVKERDLVYRKL